MTKYEIILYWSSEDDAFIAEVPELAGCAADGATRQEALANAETAIEECWKRLGSLAAHPRTQGPAAICLSRPAGRASEAAPRIALSLPFGAQMSLTTAIQAPRGNRITCKGWHQEAALRMLHNNLDPEVAENPDELIVYGGRGR